LRFDAAAQFIYRNSFSNISELIFGHLNNVSREQPRADMHSRKEETPKKEYNRREAREGNR